jgi:FtsZ-binding cell division protein ZapB
MTSINNIIREMRAAFEGAKAETDSLYALAIAKDANRWADALEAAMREPVAVVARNDSGQIRLVGSDWLAFNISAHVGTRFYALPPDAAAEIERLREAGVGYSQQTVDALQAEIERLNAVIALEVEHSAMLAKEIERLRECNTHSHNCMLHEVEVRDAEIERLREESDGLRNHLKAFEDSGGVAAHAEVFRRGADIERLNAAITQAADLCDHFDVRTARTILLDALGRIEP